MKKINEGYCAELFETEDGRLLKLYKRGWDEVQVRQEYESTKAVNNLGVPSPKVHDFIEQDGRFGFVMDKLAGKTMLQIIQKKPFQAIALAKKMAQLHYDLHCIPPSGAHIPQQEEVYTNVIDECTALNEAEKAGLMNCMKDIAKNEQRICHGDFHAMNILLSDGGMGIIDWAFATLGDPCADVAGSYMITKILAAASGGHNAVERFLFNVFTPVFAEIYLKEYLKLSGRSRSEILGWIPVRAATYVDLGLPERANRKLYRLAKNAAKGSERTPS